MKKLMLLLISLILLSSGINVKAEVAHPQGTKNCYYKYTDSNATYYTHFAFMGLGTTLTPGPIDIEAYYYNKNDLNTKNSELSVTDYGGDYIWNWMNDYGIKFSLNNHFSLIQMRVADGEEDLLDGNNTEACPSKVYKLKSSSKIYYVFCNGYNSEVNVDTCTAATDYIKSEKKFNDYTLTAYSFTTSTGFNNVGQNKEGQTNVKDTYDELKNEETSVCDEASASYDAEKCLEIQNQIGDIEDQQSDLDPNLNSLTDIGEEMGDAANVSFPDHVEGMDLCSQNSVKHVLNVVGYLLFAAKIIVPLLLIIMGTIDFAKALTDSDDKGMKDALAKLIKRIIAGVIIFFIPTIFNFIFSLMDDVSNNQNNFTQCSDCLFTPFSGNCTYTKLGQ